MLGNEKFVFYHKNIANARLNYVIINFGKLDGKLKN